MGQGEQQANASSGTCAGGKLIDFCACNSSNAFVCTLQTKSSVREKVARLEENSQKDRVPPTENKGQRVSLFGKKEMSQISHLSPLQRKRGLDPGADDPDPQQERKEKARKEREERKQQDEALKKSCSSGTATTK